MMAMGLMDLQNTKVFVNDSATIMTL